MLNVLHMKTRLQQGFSLVELSIVLVIISLLMAGGLVVGTSMVERAAYLDTRKIIDQLDQSLRDYYIVNGHLPCPAARTTSTGTSNFGMSVTPCDTTTALAGITLTGNVRIGMIPVRTLGISDSAAADKYGSRIQYAVTRQLTNAATFGASNGAVTVQDMHGNTILNNAAFFLWSAGSDRRGAPLYNTATTSRACQAASLDGENCDNDAVFREAPFNSGNVVASYFDDVVSWAPKYLLSATASESDTLWAANGDANLYSVGTDTSTTNTNVGIGTISPQERLHVSAPGHTNLRVGPSAAGSFQSALQLYNNTTNGYSLARDTAGRFALNRVNGATSTNFMGFSTTGNMGLSTLTPQERLHVSGTGHTNLRIGPSNAGSFQSALQLYNNTTNGYALARDSSGRFVMNHVNGATNTNLLTMTSAGRLGLGTLSPVSKVHLSFDRQPTGWANDVNIYHYNSHADSTLLTWWRARGSQASPTNVVNGDQIGGMFMNARIGGAWSYTSAIRANYRGNGSTLLSDMSFCVSALVRCMQMPADGRSMLIVPHRHGAYHEDWPSEWGGGIATWDITGAGTWFSQYNTRSDRRLKRDINPLEKEATLAKLRQLTPINFYWKDERVSENRQYGFIAQEVRDIWPDLVTGEEGENSFLGINYDGLIGPLVLTTQHLLEQNETLTTRVDALTPAAGSGTPDMAAPAGQQYLPLLLSFLMGGFGMYFGYRLGRRATT